MTTNENIKPLVDRILTNPLQFKQSSTKGSSNSSNIKPSSYIVIGASKYNNNKLNSNSNNKSNNISKDSENKKKEAKKIIPKSMAEALALYTKKDDIKLKDQGNKSNNLATDENIIKKPQFESESDSSNDVFHEAKEFITPNDESSKEDDSESELSDISSHVQKNSMPNDIDNSNNYSSNNTGDYMGEDLGEDLGQDVIFNNENGLASDDGSDASFEDPKENNFLSDKLQEEDENDDEDNISKISDSERIGLLEESMAFEIEKERQEDPSSSEKEQEQEKEELKHITAVLAAKEEGEDEGEEDELKHKIPKRNAISSLTPTANTPSASVMEDLSNFYQFNENSSDEGTILPSMIIKNWGKEMSTLKPRGLINHGVTCYTNAAVQAMLHIPAVQHYLWDVLRGKYKDTISSSSVTTVLAETSKKMWFPNDKLKKKLKSDINPSKLINRLADINYTMDEWQQEDSQEYFMSLMSRLQEDSVPKGHKMTESIIYNIFGGLLKQIVTCKSCGGVSKTEQPFYDLSIDLKGKRKLNPPSNNPAQANENCGSNNNNNNTKSNNSSEHSTINQVPNRNQDPNMKENGINRRFSIQKSIKDFFDPELLKVDKEQKGYICEKCKKTTNAIKHSTIIRAPETLLVHLKRFRFSGTSSKVKQAVSFPMYMDLTEYCDREGIPKNKEILPVKYQLISVVVHEGRSLSSGHYIAHCKQPDGSWATYDDEYINKISEREVLSEANAYYLIYTRLTPKTIKLKSSLPKDKLIGLPLENNNMSAKYNGGRSNNNSTVANNNKHKKAKKNKKNKKRKLNK